MKEEEKEKLHLEQQQLQHYDVYYYTKKICEIHYSIITRLIVESENEREIMDETLCEFL